MRVILLLVLTVGVAAQAPRDGVTHRARGHLKADGTVGASLYLVRGGRVVERTHYGLADRKTKRAVDADTIYHWASITKTLTAIAVLQLRDRGRLRLDDPVVDYLPEVRHVHNEFGPMRAITLRHLLTHSGGFRGPTFPWAGKEPWHPHEPRDWSQVAAMMPYTKIHFAPGSRYAYSNPGFSMLGRVVEAITGDHIEVYVQKNLFMPLGMNGSYFDRTPWHLRKHRANSYDVREDGITEHGLEFDTGATSGNGGLNAPVGDMVRYLNFLVGVADNGHFGDVLKRSTLEEMWRPVHATPNRSLGESMGMGFFSLLNGRDGATPALVYGHTGSQKGFRSFIYFDPVTRAAAVFAANSARRGRPHTSSPLGSIRRDVIDLFFATARR